MYATYRLSDGQFLRGWPNPPPYDEATESIQEYPEHLRPDQRTERFAGAAEHKKRPATDQEIQDYDLVRTTERVQGQFDNEKLVKALAIWTAQKLSIPMNTARQEILAILRGL